MFFLACFYSKRKAYSSDSSNKWKGSAIEIKIFAQISIPAKIRRLAITCVIRFFIWGALLWMGIEGQLLNYCPDQPIMWLKTLSMFKEYFLSNR